MNMIDLQEKLKDLSEQQLVREMQSPSGMAPQFLVLSEITRRKRMRESMQPQDSGSTVAEEVVASAGVPQGGIADMARSLAPKSSIAQNTGASPVQAMPEPVQGMYGGGYVQKMNVGGATTYPASTTAFLRNPAIQAMAARMGMTPQELWRTWSEQQRANFEARLPPMSPSEAQSLFPAGQDLPTQADLDARFAESQAREPIFPDSGFSQPAPMRLPMTYGRPLSQTVAARTGTLLPGDQVDLDLTSEIGDIRDTLKQFESEYTTTTEDFTRPVTEFFSRPDEMTRAMDPYTGKYVDIPTIGTQVRRAGNAVADLVSGLPMFDMSAGNPYSELSPEEMDALSGGTMSPETADAIQSARLAQSRFGRGTSGATTPMPEVPIKEQGDAGDSQPEDVTAPPSAPSDVPPVTRAPGGAAAPSGGVTSGVSRAVGAAPMSSYEQELIDAMQRAEKRAEQDKWLALAQVGLQLMSSTQPTLGGALGEAGAAGLEAFRSARNTAEEERLGLSKALYDLQASQAAAMAAQRSAGAKALSGPSLDDYLKTAKKYDEAIKMVTPVDEFGNPLPLSEAQALRKAELEMERDRALAGMIPQRTYSAIQ